MKVSFVFDVTEDFVEDFKLSFFDQEIEDKIGKPDDKQLWDLKKLHYLDEQGFLLISALEKALIGSEQYQYPYSEIVYQILTLLKKDAKNMESGIVWRKVWGEIYDFQKTLQLDKLPNDTEELAKIGLYVRSGIKGKKVYINEELLKKLNEAARS